MLAWQAVSIRLSTSHRQMTTTYGDENELGLAAAEGLESAPVAQHNLARLDDEGELFTPSVSEETMAHWNQN